MPQAPRLAFAVLVGLLLASPTAQAEGRLPLEFAVPSQLGGDANATGLEWILLVFHPEHAAITDVKLDAPVSYTNYTVAQPRVNGYYINATPAPVYYPHPARTEGELEAHASFARQASLFVQAEHLSLRAKSSSVVLDAKKEYGCAEDFLTESRESGAWIRSQCPTGQAAVLRAVAASASSGFELEAEGVTAVEWFGAGVSCTSSWCPDGGGQTVLTVPLPMGRDVSDTTYSYSHMESPTGRLQASGSALVMVTGGKKIDVDVQGWIRLAGAHATCQSCLDPANRTLSATGLLRLESLRVGSRPGVLETQVAGDATLLRLDEASVDPSLLPGLNWKVAAGAVGVAAGVWALASLFTRLVERKALRHPRRRLVYDFIRLHPGINRSDLGAATGIPDTSLRHHLTMLERSRLVTKRMIGKNVRLFPGKEEVEEESLQRNLLLRDPELRSLLEWVKGNQGALQKNALAKGEMWGWPRSTTQYRLGQLVRGGLVEAQKIGRTKRYRAVA
jgi:predicted transcriptional regulator